MMTANPTIPASQTDFGHAMDMVRMAHEIMNHIDWRGLHAILSDSSGALFIIDPTLARQVQADPEWEMKLQLVKAAGDFTATVEGIKDRIAEIARGTDG